MGTIFNRLYLNVAAVSPSIHPSNHPSVCCVLCTLCVFTFTYNNLRSVAFTRRANILNCGFLTFGYRRWISIYLKITDSRLGGSAHSVSLAIYLPIRVAYLISCDRRCALPRINLLVEDSTHLIAEIFLETNNFLLLFIWCIKRDSFCG